MIFVVCEQFDFVGCIVYVGVVVVELELCYGVFGQLSRLCWMMIWLCLGLMLIIEMCVLFICFSVSMQFCVVCGRFLKVCVVEMFLFQLGKYFRIGFVWWKLVWFIGILLKCLLFMLYVMYIGICLRLVRMLSLVSMRLVILLMWVVYWVMGVLYQLIWCGCLVVVLNLKFCLCSYLFCLLNSLVGKGLDLMCVVYVLMMLMM